MPIRLGVDFCVKWILIGKFTGCLPTYISVDKKALYIERGVAVSRRVRLNNNLSENVGHR